MNRVLPFKSTCFYIKPCFCFFFRKPKEATLDFCAKCFQTSSFCFLDKSFIKKGFFFFRLSIQNCFLFFFTNVQLRNILKSFNRVFNKKTSTQITVLMITQGKQNGNFVTLIKLKKFSARARSYLLFVNEKKNFPYFLWTNALAEIAGVL